MPKSILDQFDKVTARDRAEWRAWLEENYASSPGIWLIFFKKGSGQPSVSYDEAVEEALCYGWIDSKMNKLDEQRYIQVFTPRKPKSVWSRLNKQRVERLIAAERMTPAGLQAIEIAKKNGSWTALDEIEDLVIPPDLAEALAANPAAEQNFLAWRASRKKMILSWLRSVKNPAIRQKRVEHAIACAEKNLNPLETPLGAV